MKNSLTLIKLGGSIITNKSKPFTVQEEVLVDLVGQIKKAWNTGKVSLILGHGSGSFGHVPAEKYKTKEGLVDTQSVYGAAVVEDAACQLNRIVVAECLKQGLPAFSVKPSDFLLLKNSKVSSIRLENLLTALTQGFLPVVFGDVILDTEKGFTIWSTEQILNLLAAKIHRRYFTVDKVIHCAETDGFLVNNQVVPEINLQNFEEMKQHIKETFGFDVTGGMLHKIQEGLASAQSGIDSYIVGGNHGGNLYRTIMNKNFIGTRIRP